MKCKVKNIKLKKIPTSNKINLKPIKEEINKTPKKAKISIGFFLEEDEPAFCVIDDYPSSYIFPRVGDEISLQSFGDFPFDCYIVKHIHYNIPHPSRKWDFWVEVTVEGKFFGAVNG